MKQSSLLVCAIAINIGLTIIAGCQMAPSEQVATASAVPLVNTGWRLTQLGDEVIDNPSGERAISLQLQPQNPRVVGFAGCNRMFGGYLLNGEMLKFDQMGGTKMACVDEKRMKLEQRYFEVLSRVSQWKITGSTLELRDGEGRPQALFAADSTLRL
jgi:copper homeostasis protein (lipoprotein)